MYLSLNPTNQIPGAPHGITHFSIPSACPGIHPLHWGQFLSSWWRHPGHPWEGSVSTTSVLWSLATPLGSQSGSLLLPKGMALHSNFLTTPQCFHPFHVICISNITILNILIIIPHPVLSSFYKVRHSVKHFMWIISAEACNGLQLSCWLRLQLGTGTLRSSCQGSNSSPKILGKLQNLSLPFLIVKWGQEWP